MPIIFEQHVNFANIYLHAVSRREMIKIATEQKPRIVTFMWPLLWFIDYNSRIDTLNV